MARKAKKNQAQQPDMLGAAQPSDGLLRTNLDSPAERLYESRRLKGRAFAWVFIVAGTACIGLTLNNLVNPVDPTAGIVPVDSVAVNSSVGKSAAHTRLTQWLAGDPSPLPGGYIVSWDGFESIAGEKATSSTENPANDAEIHFFTLATDVGDKTVFYDATVLVSVSDQLGAYVSADPSLLPRVPDANQGWSSELWPGYKSVAPSDASQQSVIQWAKSFTESADALRLYVGDGDADHAYMPLQGARVLQASIAKAGHIPVEGAEDKPKTIIARVELSLSWFATGEKGSTVTYDVLIEQAHTASPKVVAWGPAGTGPTLVKFGNAITATKLTTSSNTGVPTPTPTPEETGVPVTTDEPTSPEGGDGN